MGEDRGQHGVEWALDAQFEVVIPRWISLRCKRIGQRVIRLDGGLWAEPRRALS
jgi:hypothetical protein